MQHHHGPLCDACLTSLSLLSPSLPHHRTSWGEESWSCVLSQTGINRHEAFQPWNLGYLAGFRLLFLLFTHYNRRRSHRGRLWRLQQTAAQRSPLPISGQWDVINQHWKHTGFKQGKSVFLLCCTNYEMHYVSIYTAALTILIISMNG